ncbi:MAG: hypothetical protein OIN89_00445 [Candidatus Methanoperedens sp.]|jgi:hypothetical protein|nr:hypothetical protein [Candidatus Methanoperedens sp.]PKL54711.1 MAG: hypothetical protein CVV36_00445 [Candidatus Methanoperedenaceae archaeon HGW-Methanoperedenaceae-1]
MDKKTKLALGAGAAVGVVTLAVPVSTVFVTLLLGMLLIPPVVGAGYVLVYGASVISREISEKEKDVMVVRA